GEGRPVIVALEHRANGISPVADRRRLYWPGAVLPRCQRVDQTARDVGDYPYVTVEMYLTSHSSFEYRLAHDPHYAICWSRRWRLAAPRAGARAGPCRQSARRLRDVVPGRRARTRLWRLARHRRVGGRALRPCNGAITAGRRADGQPPRATPDDRARTPRLQRFTARHCRLARCRRSGGGGRAARPHLRDLRAAQPGATRRDGGA